MIAAYLEIRDGKIKKSSLEALSEARRRAGELGLETAVVLVGASVAGLAPSAFALGAAKVYAVEHPALADYSSQAYAIALAGFAAEAKPAALFFAATALREIEGGLEKVSLILPAVVTAQKGLNEPRYETLKGIMAAKKKPVPAITLDELGFGPDDLRSAVEIVGLDVPAARQAGKVLTGDPAETARELVRLLRDEAKVI